MSSQSSYAFSKKLFPDSPWFFIYNVLVFSLTSTKKSNVFPWQWSTLIWGNKIITFGSQHVKKWTKTFKWSKTFDTMFVKKIYLNRQKWWFPTAQHPPITPTICYLIALPKRAVFVKKCCSGGKRNYFLRFGKMKNQGLVHSAFGYSGWRSIRG